MTREAPSQEPVAYRVNEDALVQPARAREAVTENANVLMVAEQKADRGERLSPEERTVVFDDLRRQFIAGMNRHLRESKGAPGGDKVCSYTQGTHDGLKRAIILVYSVMMALSEAHMEKRHALEDRIAALEAAAKPKSRTRLMFLPSRDNGIRDAHE